MRYALQVSCLALFGLLGATQSPPERPTPPPCAAPGGDAVRLQTTIGGVREHGGPLKFRSLQAVARVVDAKDASKVFGFYAIDERADRWILIVRGVTRPDVVMLTVSPKSVQGSFQHASGAIFPDSLRLQACIPRSG